MSPLATSGPPTSTPAASDLVRFASESVGVAFGYPRRLQAPEYRACAPMATATSVTLGGNIVVEALTSERRSLEEALAAWIESHSAEIVQRRDVQVGGLEAVRVEYRLRSSARFGIATIAGRGDVTYAFVFEARNPGQCGESSPTELYEILLESVEFLE